ncbi:hypothetical protein [Weissella paramesenteroides]|uniref:Uncharacterized protein n=1 Tax=Weissella paramesenteroides ATCC 33313 TaxID=585506 RepID=C5R896_WEIPA|nr:hypothetical protein [Weissella paramesenteroides]EER75680.1 hypothetical protein HMPREF0877_0191 [Weissella paramesenteroides ATCC 33313]
MEDIKDLSHRVSTIDQRLEFAKIEQLSRIADELEELNQDGISILHY